MRLKQKGNKKVISFVDAARGDGNFCSFKAF